MNQANILRRYGLFDAKVPRYTSYPPANRFEPGLGARHHPIWLSQVQPEDPVSVYVHIPFCRRLCWFCACRTQGTKTLAPVEAYVDTLIQEIDVVTRDNLPSGVQMKRLHLGGGTPTLLNAALMDRLLAHIHERFSRAHGFEFSVEIDPTEAEDGVLDVLSDYSLTRASIGVQDFNLKVQKAIGRPQSFSQTNAVIAALRGKGVQSLNIDLLYGLPFQNGRTLLRTLDEVIALNPDRVALYGYAHVPHVSKRQVMIPSEALPGPEQRYDMAELAKSELMQNGFKALGIDHFAHPDDSLSRAAELGTMTRNFQGYTDDTCKTLLGFGASAISKFPEGYVQNAVATSAYNERIKSTGHAGHKGVALTAHDRFIAYLIDAIMCRGEIVFSAVAELHPNHVDELSDIIQDLVNTYPDAVQLAKDRLTLRDDIFVLARCISARIDRNNSLNAIHSLAV